MNDLAQTSRSYQRLRAKTAETYAVLVPLIRQARKSGMTLRAIADVTGLSFARIYQIEKEQDD